MQNIEIYLNGTKIGIVTLEHDEDPIEYAAVLVTNFASQNGLCYDDLYWELP